MKIGIIGSGVVATTLGGGFLKHGHDVALGTREPAKLAAWRADNPGAKVASFAEAAVFGSPMSLQRFEAAYFGNTIISHHI
jgi:8-hydroxy-5-deazaflavin:NADPH oxidoreductase